MSSPLAKGWKVITHNRKSIATEVAPAWVLHYASNARVKDYPGRIYPKRRRVYPADGQGPLAVFETKEQAKEFLTTWQMPPAIEWVGGRPLYPRIVECRYRPSERDRLEINSPTFKAMLRGSALPKGTVLADFVTCLE